MATDLKLSGYKAVQQATCVELELIEDGTPVTVRMTDHDVPLSVGGTPVTESSIAFSSDVKFAISGTFMSAEGETYVRTGANTFTSISGMTEITSAFSFGATFAFGKSSGGAVVSARFPGSGSTWNTTVITGWNQTEKVISGYPTSNMVIGGDLGTYAYASNPTSPAWVTSTSLQSTSWGSTPIRTMSFSLGVANAMYFAGDNGKIFYGTNIFTSPSWTALSTSLLSTDHVTMSAFSGSPLRVLFGTSTGKLRYVTSASPATTVLSITTPAEFTGEITMIRHAGSGVFYVANASGRVLTVSLAGTSPVVTLWAQNFGARVLQITISGGITYVFTTQRVWASNDLTTWTQSPAINLTVGSNDFAFSRVYGAARRIYSLPTGQFSTPTVYQSTGDLLNVSQITSEVKPSSSDVTITLSGINNDYIADIISNPIKGSRVIVSKMFIDPLTSLPLQIAGNPAIVFKGVINNFSIEEGWQDQENQTPTSTISLTCNSSVGILSNKITGRRTNHADQTYWFSGDMSMDRVGVISDVVFDFGGVTPVNNNNVSVPKTITG